jgi:hypothetical protein
MTLAVLGITVYCLAGADRLAAAELELSSGPGRAGSVSWESVELHYRPEQGEVPGSWQFQADGLAWEDGTEIGAIEIACRQGRMRQAGPDCEAGSLSWRHGLLADGFEAEFRLASHPERFEVSLVDGPLQGRVAVPRDGQLPTMDLQVDGLSLARLPAELLGEEGLRDLEGTLSGALEFAEGRLQGELQLEGAGFDSADGVTAGFGIDASVAVTFQLGDDGQAFELDLVQHDGELLLGPVYLPPPEAPLRLLARGQRGGDGSVHVDHLEFHDPESLSLAGELALARVEEAWSLRSVQLHSAQFQFPLAWERWLDGPLAARGMAGMETAGRLEGSLELSDGTVVATGVIEGFHLDDPQGRFGLDQVNAELFVDDRSSSLMASWGAIYLYGLPLGASTLRMAGDGDQISLVEPLSMPLLDGAVVIERLLWEYADVEERELQLDARIEPLDLAELTGVLGFPEFGGVLSGNFPGVRYVDEVLSFTGGIDIQAFSGRIELKDLAVERPFGTLPALAAQVEFHRLDLAELTGAFNFGRMEGQMSGWMHDLRLLDWRPVAMDARVFTHSDVRRRRISQRAVENLSNLGGAGGALITGTVLRVFDEFPYRRAGLACRLSNNICYIDGVAQHDSGGFYIVQGRSLPRLDIVGHRRLVDWPQLMAQLAAMMEEG